MKNRIVKLLAIIAVLGITNGCIREDLSSCDSCNDPYMLLTLRVPGTSTPTRALSQSEEHVIKTLDVLVFEDDGTTETFLYRTHGTDIGNNAGSLDKKYKVMLRKSIADEKHRIVLLANLRDEIDDVEDEFTSSMTKDQVLAKIKFDSDQVWDTKTNQYTPLPMYGEAAESLVITGSTNGGSIGVIKMLRSVSRIDVGLKFNTTTGESYTAQGFGDLFRISDIKLYNTNKSGYAAPAAANLEANKEKVSLPTVPANDVNTNPLTYSVDISQGAPGQVDGEYGRVRDIYISECVNKGKDDEDVMYLIIGGYYTKPGDALNETEETWYRIDFYDRDSEDEPEDVRLDILRNHKYVVNITSVDGPGYPDEEQAKKSRPVNMKSKVIAWDDANIGDIKFDDQYMLGVSHRVYEVGKKAKTGNTIHVYTDYPEGWTYAIKESANPESDDILPEDWIRCITTETDDDKFVFAVDENGTKFNREAYLHVKAGRLDCVVKIVQTTISTISLELMPEYELVFPSGIGSDIFPQSVTVRWDPADADVQVTKVRVNNNEMLFEAGHSFPAILENGEVTFTLQPLPMTQEEIGNDGTKEKVARLDFYLEDDGNHIMRSLFIRQRHQGISYEFNTRYDDDLYAMIGGTTDDLIIYANSPWRATLLAGGKVINSLINGTETGSGNILGEYLQFSLNWGAYEDPGLYHESVIRVESTSVPPAFPATDIVVTGVFGFAYSGDYGKRIAAPFDYAYNTDTGTRKTYNRGDAIDKCNDMANKAGWYLPSIDELYSMYSHLGTTPTEQQTHFFDPGQYWSSSKRLAASNFYWLRFSDGKKDDNILGTAKYNVRCIRKR